MVRIYFHIDLNAFFANAEVLRNPDLKGKALVVSGYSRRSVVSTASYEARSFGIHSAMPITEAERLCKNLIIIEPHFAYYKELSSQFISIIQSYTKEVEQASIDECYADVTDIIFQYQKPLDLACIIQKRILKEVGIPCSIGIGPNMFLAKMASDYKKPLGITVFRIREVESKLWPLDIKEMRGVGNKTIPFLKDMGIHTIGDLANWKDIDSLYQIFGKNTEKIIQRAKGYDTDKITRDINSKSMGVSETMLEDITDYDEIKGLIRILSKKLSTRLLQSKKIGYSISLKIKYYDFQSVERSKKLECPIWKTEDIYVQALSLFDSNWDDDAIRLLGISISDFASEEFIARQINLFDQQSAALEQTERVLQEFNQELGFRSLVRASDLLRKGK